VSPMTWLLVGAIVGGTSSVIIIPTVAKGSVPAGVASLLEVESAATDALSVVMAMVIIDYLVSGVTDASRPIITLARQLGLGFVLGGIGAALLAPMIPPLRDRPHGYTVFLASMLALYAMAESMQGNGAMAVLTASLLLGNASSIVPRLFPGAKGHVFAATQISSVMMDQMSFLIKSFFFFLIGLMFPTDLRQMALAGAATLLLLLFRIPAVKLATKGVRLTRKEFWLLSVAMPRGLAAGVLATLPLHYGIAGAENLSSAIFALIVFSVLIFAAGVAIVSRFADERPIEQTENLEPSG